MQEHDQILTFSNRYNSFGTKIEHCNPKTFHLHNAHLQPFLPYIYGNNLWPQHDLSFCGNQSNRTDFSILLRCPRCLPLNARNPSILSILPTLRFFHRPQYVID
ncbi:hypothetical protein BIW11_00662 [Tropilaelaps mercedesae]|uniref:Uncharacterized protein n=1 Tax=Tropilaelaps mercedesae TaxID=418985 RepID=A0A1V9XRP1_9ACAR|nr:hypothetical protein BIW11_00662 [Tropilaelaps mercedesae]